MLKYALRPVLCLLVCLLIYSCAAPLTLAPPPQETGAFSLYLQPLPQETHRLNFTIGELVALRVDGTEIPLILRQTEFLGNNLDGEQKKLVSVTLPPGRYLGLRIQIESVTLNGEEGKMDLLSPESPVRVDYSFSIYEGRAEVLMLSLSADRLVTDGAFFTPKFSLWEHEQILTSLKGFVSNSGSESLTIFNKRTAHVVDAIQIGREPTGLALDQRRGWLYVALAKEHKISVVEINTNDILGQIRLRFGDEPTELVLSDSGNRLLVLNRGSHTVSIIDTTNLFEQGRIKLPADANDILISPDGNRGYAIHAAAGLLSVLDLNSYRIQRSIALDYAPIKGAISADGRTLYLATDYSADLLVMDAGSLSVLSKITVGVGGQSLLRDKTSGVLYVGKQSGEIAIVDPRVLMAIDTFSMPAGLIQSMTIDKDENALFAVMPQQNRLLKFDLISKRQIGSLELGAVSHAVVVMGER
ncbi:MAG: YncE family protein [Desulfuromonadales bacterium]|nr:YncE family protein [Desulfuromonadales bacterium]